MRDAAGNIAHYIAVKQDITQRKALEAKLVDVSRQAGMAEIATGVLHNVGNVLNSLNVSVDVLAEQVRSTPVDELDRVIELLRAQGPNLASYFADGPRGPKVIEYLSSLSLMLRGLKDGEFGELSSLRRNTDHIKDIVVTQQNYATTAGLTEKVHVNDLIEDTLAMGAVVLHRDQVRVVREFARDVPPVTTEKYKVLQVLVNLMKNARHACNASQRDDKQIIVRVTHSRENVRLQVIDNGIGISADHLNRIFSHGFTTKNNGHGFGLHNSANAAMEIGGSLSAQSDGPGFGATFTLEIPLRYHAATAAADRN
jgi:signal transduction histidine kinase